MLLKKFLLFNKLLKLSFFYRIKKEKSVWSGLIGTHNSCMLFKVDDILYFIFRLIPFFLNLIKKQGGLLFIGVDCMLLKWFKKQVEPGHQELVFV